MSSELDKISCGQINISGVHGVSVISGPNDHGFTTVASNVMLRDMSVPLKVHYQDKIHEFRLPAACTLKELYQALSKQLAGIDPNGELMLERQAEATYEVKLPPGTY